MQESDKLRIKAINKYLEYISADLENMTDFEQEDLWFDMKRNLPRLPNLISGFESFGIVDTDDPEGSTLTKDGVYKRFAREVQQCLRETFEKLFLKPEGEEFLEIGKAKIRFASMFGVGMVSFSPVFEPKGKVKDVKLEGFKNMAQIGLCLSLSGLDNRTIKKCGECGKYFLHLSAKAKYYCNVRCTSRASSRKRREENPEEYRRKQREIMRKKYKEIQSKKTGIPVDKIKIQKRSPSKKKT